MLCLMLIKKSLTLVKNMSLASVAVLVAALWMFAPLVHACSCSFPTDWGFIGAGSGRLPANAAGVAWFTPEEIRDNEDLAARFTAEIRKASEFRLLPVKVSPVEDFPGIYVIAPEGEGLKPGATYRFTVDKADPYGRGHKQALVAIDHQVLSTKTELILDIGPITTEIIGVAAGVSCSDGLEVSQVKVEGKLAKDAQHWREQMLYRTIVDGEINWMAHRSLCETIPPGRSWEGVGYDRIFAPCRKLSGLHYVKYNLAPARHTLKIQAFLPGTGVVLKTDVKLVDLRCA